MQEFNDFIEITREAVSGVSKEINGTKVAVFGEEDVAEIIIAQVESLSFFIIKVKMLTCDRSRSFFYWPDPIQHRRP